MPATASKTSAKARPGAVDASAVRWLAWDSPVCRSLGDASQEENPSVPLRRTYWGDVANKHQFETEVRGGAPKVDVLTLGLSWEVLRWRDEGLFSPLGPEGFATLHGTAFVIAYNPASVAQREAPRSFADLADPRWKGRLAVPNPERKGFGVYLARFALAHRDLGLPWFRALHANRPSLADSPGAVIEEIASGARAVGLVRDMDAIAAEKSGMAVSHRVPEGEFPYLRVVTSLSREAPRADAAKRFAQWLLSSRSAEIVRSLTAFTDERQAAESGAWSHKDAAEPEEVFDRWMGAVVNALKKGRLPTP